ncbi:MAG: hypothetical protein ACHBN1_23430 [Heteroscytonema crispum UTEX LB 1556]
MSYKSYGFLSQNSKFLTTTNSAELPTNSAEPTAPNHQLPNGRTSTRSVTKSAVRASPTTN